MPSIPSSAIQQFASGDLDYIDKLNTNFEALRAGVNANSDALAGSAAATSFTSSLDAANNIENACHNGAFQLGLNRGDLGLLSAPPRNNDAHGTRRIENVDGWFISPDFYEPSAEAYSIEVTKDNGDLLVEPGAGMPTGYTGGLTGRIFQRLDWYWPIEELRGRPFTFWVRYTAVTDDEFYLLIDDGVTTTSTQLVAAGPSPAGQNNRFVSHTIDAAATKLSVQIVLLKDAVSGANALRIHECYGRFGSAVVALPFGKSPSVTPRDILKSLMQNRCWSFGVGERGVVWPAVQDASGALFHYRDLFMHTPLVYADPDDVVEEVEVSGSDTDPYSLQAPGVLVEAELAGALVWSNKNMVPSAQLRVTSAASVAATGQTGYFANQVDYKVAVIPSP